MAKVLGRIIKRNEGLNRKQRRELARKNKLRLTKGFKKIRTKIWVGCYDITKLIKNGMNSNEAYKKVIENHRLGHEELLNKQEKQR